MALSMLSLGIEAALAFATAVASVGLTFGASPPSRAACSVRLASLASSFPRAASWRPLRCLMFAHFECPAMVISYSDSTRSRNMRWMRSSGVSSGWKEAAITRSWRTMTGWPSTFASTSTPSPVFSTHGARMNTAWNGSSSPSTSRSASNESFWRPKAFRWTTMSRTPSSGWLPSVTEAARKIIPAQVPNAAMPSPIRRRRGSISSNLSASLPIVVDSPPGTTIPSRSSSCSGVLTGTGSAPSAVRVARCSLTSPWRASTPTRGTGSPAPFRQTLGVAELGDLDARHGFAQARRDLRHLGGVFPVGGGLDDGASVGLRIRALEDPGADEDAVAAESHHQGGISRGGDTAGGEVHDRQTTLVADDTKEVDGSAHVTGGGHELFVSHLGDGGDLVV